jgi:hypothetical protein
MEEVTLFITSCGRPELLRRTLESFVKFNTYPIKLAILCEDSGIKGIADFARSILPYDTIIFYNDERIGQMKTIQKYTPLITTQYVFHLEDDYEFFISGFIELSFKILESDPNITQLLLEDEQYNFPTIDINNPLCLKCMTSDGSISNQNNGDGPLSPYSWRPSLKTIKTHKLRMPYELWDDEYTIQLHLNKMGKYSVISRLHKTGFCKHIGKDAHVQDSSHIKIISRKDFPDKINIRLNDIIV